MLGRAALVAFLLLLTSVACATRSTGGAYLDELEAAGLLDQFESEGAAVRAGHETCERIDGGGYPEGTEAERIAVDHFCDEYLGQFEVVDQARIAPPSP
jgi:hypothetical protein